MFKYLSTQDLFSYSPSERVIVQSKEKEVSAGNIRNTVFLLSSSPNNYFKTL